MREWQGSTPPPAQGWIRYCSLAWGASSSSTNSSSSSSSPPYPPPPPPPPPPASPILSSADITPAGSEALCVVLSCTQGIHSNGQQPHGAAVVMKRGVVVRPGLLQFLSDPKSDHCLFLVTPLLLHFAQIVGFVKVVSCYITWICQICSLFFSPIAKKQAEVWPRFQWRFCFELMVLNESKYSMPWVRCAFGNFCTVRLWPCNCYMKCKTKRAFNILVYIVVGDDDFDILNLENVIIQVKIMTSQKNVRGDNIWNLALPCKGFVFAVGLSCVAFSYVILSVFYSLELSMYLSCKSNLPLPCNHLGSSSLSSLSTSSSS